MSVAAGSPLRLWHALDAIKYNVVRPNMEDAVCKVVGDDIGLPPIRSRYIGAACGAGGRAQS
jgi:hypothetical protein